MTELASRLVGVRVFVLVFVAVLLTGCGGGGGDSPGTTTPPPPPPPPPPTGQSISGLVMLGPVANADIEILGTAGVLATGTTAADGTFGPIDYDGDYTGPLRIRASGNGSSTWVCDIQVGCPDGPNWVETGGTVTFDGPLEAVLPVAVDGQHVTVSLLSNWVSKRVDVLGPLTEANVNAAQTDIADLLRLTLSESLSLLSVDVPDDFTTLPLFNLHALPAPSGEEDALRLLLTFYNASAQLLGYTGSTTGEVIDIASGQVAANPDLPVSAPEFWDASQESLTTAMGGELWRLFSQGNAPLPELDALFAPTRFEEVVYATLNQASFLPSLHAAAPFGFDLDVRSLPSPPNWLVPVVTSDGTPVSVADMGVQVSYVGPVPGTWLSVSLVLANGEPHLLLELDPGAISSLPPGEHQQIVAVFSTTGEYASDTFPVNLSVPAPFAYAGDDITANELSTVLLEGAFQSPETVTSIGWSQLAGPTVSIEQGDTLTPSVALPDVVAADVVTLELAVSFASGTILTDTMDINIQAYANFGDVDFPDPVLQACVNDAAAAGGLVGVNELTALSCSGVTDASAIDTFSELVSLDLSGNDLSTIAPILALENLAFVDLRGNARLPCKELDQLAARLTEGVDLLVDDSCVGSFIVELGGEGFDAAIDAARDRAYVSLPARNEIAILSLSELHVIDRLEVPGAPHGIDLSIDGTRLFVALKGSNAVADVDLDTLEIETIPLAAVSPNGDEYDVVEGAPGRLFVVESGGHVLQVRLDQGNAASIAAGSETLDYWPTLTRSPDHQFVYVGGEYNVLKLSLAGTDAPLAGRTLISDTRLLTVDRNGARLHVRGGDVLRTDTMEVAGRAGYGRAAAATLSDTLFLARPSATIRTFDFNTLEEGEARPTNCRTDTDPTRLFVYDDDQSFLMLLGDTLCFDTDVRRSAPPDPYTRFRFPDLALEACVIDTVVAMGYQWPGQVRSLDCSSSTPRIQSLDGIERLSNLETLDISISSVFDLSPLAGHGALRSLIAPHNLIGSAAPLSGIASLEHAELTGNTLIVCTELDALAANGVTVVTDVCSDAIRLDLGGDGHEMAYGTGDLFWVSVPGLNRVIASDLETAILRNEFLFSGQPRGIELADDNRTLYVALQGSGTIAALDTVTADVELIDIATELGDTNTWDVAEISDGRVVVTTNAGPGGDGYVVEVRRDLGNQATRIADERVFGDGPMLAVDSIASAVYVGASEHRGLWKLDATQADLPIVAESHLASGTRTLSLNGTGTVLYLASGEALDTATLTQVAQFPPGVTTGDVVVGDTEADVARLYSVTGKLIGMRSLGCDLDDLMELRWTAKGIVALGDDAVCWLRARGY